jgi:hypothetical protein
MKVFGYSISLNVLILIGVLYLIMVVNALSGSCNKEGFNSADAKVANVANSLASEIMRQPKPMPAASKQSFLSRLQNLSLLTKNPLFLGKIMQLKSKVSTM